MAHGARTVTGVATGKVGAQLLRAAGRLREGKRKVVPGRRPAVTDGAGEHDSAEQAPD